MRFVNVLSDGQHDLTGLAMQYGVRGAAAVTECWSAPLAVDKIKRLI